MKKTGRKPQRPRIRALAALVLALLLALAVSASAFVTETVSGVDFGDFGQKAYQYLRVLDGRYPDRDSAEGRDFKASQEWITAELLQSGFTEAQVELQEFTFRPEGGRKVRSANVVATLPGRTDARVVVGAHYDGTGAGDNASGVALLLETADRLVRLGQPEKTLVFAFFSAEEYDCDGSAFFVENMTKNESARTEYMVNLDSVITGDYCYVYGGVADFDREVVNGTQPVERVYGISRRLGLNVRLIPWTFEDPAPGFKTPDYPSPSTGDWSDHISFADAGIPYVYFEATNWEIPGPDRQYDGDSETREAGRIMHSDSDRLDAIEALFPGRALYHLQVFSLLLHETLTGE